MRLTLKSSAKLVKSSAAEPTFLAPLTAVMRQRRKRPRSSCLREKDGKPWGNKGLTGRSARVVVTMGMPAVVYRWYFRAHSVKSLKRNVLGFVGLAPVHETLIGMTGDMKPDAAVRWLDKLERLGTGAE